MQIHLKYNL